jgi:2-polyprenyl-3-methyl-5-hydroxy-6-metoxy-1,4-benzoquinol methylase
VDGNNEPQNIYDDAGFFAAYSQLERFGKPFGAAFEHAAFMSLLPPVRGLRALDLGCGAGQLSHHLAQSGAAEVVGVDVSERMLAVARQDWCHPSISYVRGAIEDQHFPAGRFDLVVSSLAFHYVDDYAGLVHRIARWLAAEGTLVFSTEHPLYLSRATDDGWVSAQSDGARYWALDRYADEGLREESWLTSGVRKYHRTLATLVNEIIDAGLVVERVLEPMPTLGEIAARPDWALERKRPTFLLVRARRL